MSNLQELSAVKLINPLVEYQSDPLNPARGVALKNCSVFTSGTNAFIIWDKYDSYAIPFDPESKEFLENAAVGIADFQAGGTILIWETEEIQGDSPRKYMIEGVTPYCNPQQVDSTMGQVTLRINLALGSSEDVEVLTRVSDEGPDFEHLTHNENFDYYFTDLVDEEPETWDSPIPYSNSPVKFSPEEFLKRQYPGYAWVVNRNLVVMHEQANGLGFVTPDINTEAKYLRIRTFGPTKANDGIREMAQLGTSKYFYIERPTAVQASGCKYPMYGYIANLDEFFSYDWMFLQALHAVNPEVLFHFKFYDRMSKYGHGYTSDVIPNGTIDQTDTNTLQLGDCWYDPSAVDAYCGYNSWVDYLNEPYRSVTESDQTTWIKDASDVDELPLNQSLRINYATYCDTNSDSDNQYLLPTTAIMGQLNGPMVARTSVGDITGRIFSSIAVRWEKVNPIIPYQIEHPKWIYNLWYDDDVYANNGKYTYLVVHVDAFKNKLYRADGHAVDTDGHVNLTSAGNWITASTFDSKDVTVDKTNVIDNQNLFYLIPIDSEDRVCYYGYSDKAVYRNSVSWLISAISKQQVQVSVQKTDTSTVTATVPGIFTDIQQYVAGKIVIDYSPLELGMGSFNSEANFAFNKHGLFLTDVDSSNQHFTGNGLISLIFSMTSINGSSTLVVPAIVVGENGINLIGYNNYSSFSGYTGEFKFFDKFIDLFSNIPQSSWTTNSEPMLYGAGHFKHEWRVDGKQAPIITAPMIDFERFCIKPWKMISKLQASGGGCQWKYEFPDIKNSNFPWDDMESNLTAGETRQSPMAIDGQTGAFYQTALQLNQSVYAYSQNNDFTSKWTKIQNDNASTGAILGMIGGVIGAAGAGAAGGMGKGGSVAAATVGAAGGAVAATMSGITDIIATGLENENRSEQLALNQNIAQSQNAYSNLGLAQAVNKTMSIPVSIAPLNVKNTDLVGEKSVPLKNTYIEPEIVRNTALLRWQHLGYPYGMKAHFADYDNRVNYNVVTVDWLNKEHYIKESIFTWLEDNLAQKSLFLFADEICLTLLAKLTGFYRLWHIVPSIDSGVIDAGIRASNIEHTLKAKIESGELNSDGLPALRPWPTDYSPWWTKPYSDMELYGMEYVSSRGGTLVIYGISDYAFRESNRNGTVVFKPVGDVVPSSVNFEIKDYSWFEWVSESLSSLISPSSTTYTAVVDNGTLTLTAEVKLNGTPAISANTKTESANPYNRLLFIARGEISWEDSLGYLHTKTIVTECIPQHITHKEFSQLAANELVSDITFVNYPKAHNDTAHPGQGFKVQFNLTDSSSTSLHEAFQIRAFNTVSYARRMSHLTAWDNKTQVWHPIAYNTYGVNGNYHMSADWNNFLVTGDGYDVDGTGTASWVGAMPKPVFWDKLTKFGYHPDYPNVKFKVNIRYAEPVTHNPHGDSLERYWVDLVEITFGEWTTIPTDTTDGVFESIPARAYILTDDGRSALNGSHIVCTIIDEI